MKVEIWIYLVNISILYKVIDLIKGNKRKDCQPVEDGIFPFLFDFRAQNGEVEK
jgi:hypothetical protein